MRLLRIYVFRLYSCCAIMTVELREWLLAGRRRERASVTSSFVVWRHCLCGPQFRPAWRSECASVSLSFAPRFP